MKKKVLLSLLALAMSITVFGCSKAPETATSVTYEDLKTSTETAYKDIKSGKIEMQLSADIVGTPIDDNSEYTNHNADADINIVTVFDDNTIYMTVNWSGQTAPINANKEIYIDYSVKDKALMYVKYSDVWLGTEGSLEDFLSVITSEMLGYVDLDITDNTSFDVFSNDTTIKTKDDSYIVSGTWKGVEMFDILNEYSNNSLDMYKSMITSYLETVTITIKNTYNNNKVLNKVNVSVDVSDLNFMDVQSIDADMDIEIAISDINQLQVEIPADVIENVIFQEIDYEDMILDILD